MYFRLSYSKFARDLQNTQTQISKKMKTEPKSLSFLCAYVWQIPKYFFRIFENPKIFGFFGLGYEYGPKPKPKRNQNEIVWQLALWFK